MELYQRIKKVAKSLTGSDAALATLLGLKQNTFSGYLNSDRQDHLWPLLPHILKEFPRLSRQWLYFGEGPMLIGQGIPLDEPVPLLEVAKAVEHMAKDAKGIDSTLLHMVAGISPEQDATEKVRELEQRITEMQSVLEEERRLNRQLVTKLLVDGAGDKDGQTNIGKTADGAK